MLVCSPSNGGCDELARRLKHDIDKDLIQVGDKEFALVRIGRMESIHDDCDSIVLENLVKKKTVNIEEAKRNESLSIHYESLKATEKNLQQKIDDPKHCSNLNLVSLVTLLA